MGWHQPSQQFRAENRHHAELGKCLALARVLPQEAEQQPAGSGPCANHSYPAEYSEAVALAASRQGDPGLHVALPCNTDGEAMEHFPQQ